jgi:hypothetical protein
MRRAKKKYTENTYVMANCRQHSPSRDVKSYSNRKEIIHFLCNSFNIYVIENALLRTKEIPAVYTEEGTTQACTPLHEVQFQA